MAIRTQLDVQLTASNDNVPNPTDIVFSSGKKSLIDSTSYNESSSFSYEIPDATVDLVVNKGSISVASLTYILAKATGITVKLVAEGSTDPSLEYELIANVPMIIPARLTDVSISNASGAAVKVQVLMLGN